MHTFMRAIGFSGPNSNIIYKEFIKEFMNSDEVKKHSVSRNEETVEFFKYINENIGIAIHGQFNENNLFEMEYCFPFVKADFKIVYDNIVIEENSYSLSFSASCDDESLGILLIFYVENCLDYINYIVKNDKEKISAKVGLTAFSVDGKIIMPIADNNRFAKSTSELRINRNYLIGRAKNGDEDAVESLALDEMNTYNKISKRIKSEDIYSVIDTSFMPNGIECNRYSIIGEILKIDKLYNSMTGKVIYDMQIEANNLLFNLVINEDDLEGVPEVKRRFKGIIWLQGKLEILN